MRVRRVRSLRGRAQVEALDRTIFGDGSYPLEVHEDTPAWLLWDPDRTIPVGYLVADGPELERFGILRVGRGRGGSRKLLRAFVRYARDLNVEMATTYTSPDNVESMRALIRDGWLPADYEIDSDATEWILWERKL